MAQFVITLKRTVAQERNVTIGVVDGIDADAAGEIARAAASVTKWFGGDEKWHTIDGGSGDVARVVEIRD